MSAARQYAKRWCFTINNFNEEDIDQLQEISEDENVIEMICEREHTQGEGTPHIQGFISFSNRKTRQSVSSLIPKAHLEVAKGTWKENWRYCSKEGTVFIEKGHSLQEAESGDKVPFEIMYQDMKTISPTEFENKYPKFWVYHKDKVLSIMCDHAMAKATNWGGDLQQKNIWLWGAPGIGKSKWATSQGPMIQYLKKNFNKWWDGYCLITTKYVILEDYPCLPQGNILAQHLKVWADRYPFTGECKGSHLLIEPGRFFFIITSNYPIESCFNQEEDITAIKRRFQVIEMTQENKIMIENLRCDTSILNE